MGFDPVEAAVGPIGGDVGIDERELSGVGWLVLEKECGGEGFELGRVIARDQAGMASRWDWDDMGPRGGWPILS